MNVVDKLVRLLKDDYKVGVEARSEKPVLYIDPNRIDQWAVSNALKKGDLDALARQLGDQFDEQYPGISAKFTKLELIGLMRASQEMGPFAYKSAMVNQICIINQPMGPMLENENIYKTFGFGIFLKEHLRPLPGSSAQWKELVGEHEGEHCNQESTHHNDPDAALRTLDKEIKSDIASISTLRKNGHHDIVQAVIDFRSILAANGDNTHATGIFLNGQGYHGATKEHLAAATMLNKEMALAVSEHLDISPTQAEKLRTDDPQKFARTIENALNGGRVPAFRDADMDTIKSKIAEKMGLGRDDFDFLGGAKLPEIMATYKALKADGEITVAGPDNPHLRNYMQHYTGAVQRLFVPDTTPAVSFPPAAPVYPVLTDQELTVMLSADEMKEDANRQTTAIMDFGVARQLNISYMDTQRLKSTDPEKYIEAAKNALKNGNIALETHRDKPLTETNQIIAKTLGVSTQDLYAPYFQESFEYQITRNKLLNEGALGFTYENPYVAEKIQKVIETLTTSPDEEQVERTRIEGGTPQIDLRSGDRAQMKIGNRPVPEYFSLQANPQPVGNEAAPEQSPNDLHIRPQPSSAPMP